MNPMNAKVSGCAALFAGLLTARAAGQATIERVSVDSAGKQASLQSRDASISADGRFVVFSSYAANLVPGDTNNSSDIFLHDRQSGRTTLVSVDSNGVQANDSSGGPTISADGRFVSFASGATNLVGGDANGAGDVFVRDLQNGTTEIVSVDSTGAQANNSSGISKLSADGRFVAFISFASNLVAGDTNGVTDIFVRDRQSGTTEMASVDSSGVEGNNWSFFFSISGDGRYVAFDSYANNLDPADVNGFGDVFVHDRQTGTTELVSVDSNGAAASGDSSHPSISPDGNLVAFQSVAADLVSNDVNQKTDVFMHDRTTGITELVSVDSSGNQGDDHSQVPAISADGRYIAFLSHATNLTTTDSWLRWQVYRRDRLDGITTFVSMAADESPGFDDSDTTNLSTSADGRSVAFTSLASNLVAGDTNGWSDVFVRDTGPLLPIVTSSAPARARYDSGASVTLRGSNFLVGAPVTVSLGGAAASNVQVLDDTTLTCDLPLAAPGPATITVQNGTGPAGFDGLFTFTPAVGWSGDATLGGTIEIDYLCDPLDGMFAIAGAPPVLSIPTPPFDGALAIGPFVVLFVMPPRIWGFDQLGLAATIPNDPSLSGVTVLLQSLTGPSFHAPRDAAWTNCAELTIH